MQQGRHLFNYIVFAIIVCKLGTFICPLLARFFIVYISIRILFAWLDLCEEYSYYDSTASSKKFRYPQNALLSIRSQCRKTNFRFPLYIKNNLKKSACSIVKRNLSRHRGWQAALRLTTPSKLSLPVCLTLNCRSLLNKVAELTSLLNFNFHKNTCAVVLEEPWLNTYGNNNFLDVPTFLQNISLLPHYKISGQPTSNTDRVLETTSTPQRGFLQNKEIQQSQSVVDTNQTGVEEYLLEILRWSFLIHKAAYLEIYQTTNRTVKNTRRRWFWS